jgi:hypothetical protein
MYRHSATDLDRFANLLRVRSYGAFDHSLKYSTVRAKANLNFETHSVGPRRGSASTTFSVNTVALLALVRHFRRCWTDAGLDVAKFFDTAFLLGRAAKRQRVHHCGLYNYVSLRSHYSRSTWYFLLVLTSQAIVQSPKAHLIKLISLAPGKSCPRSSTSNNMSPFVTFAFLAFVSITWATEARSLTNYLGPGRADRMFQKRAPVDYGVFPVDCSNSESACNNACYYIRCLVSDGRLYSGNTKVSLTTR